MSNEYQLAIQEIPPRDRFADCTLTVEQWLAACVGGAPADRLKKWQRFLQAGSIALSRIRAQEGLRDEPRVGYDARTDQSFFIFKVNNNGTTFLVSEFGLELGDEEIRP